MDENNHDFSFEAVGAKFRKIAAESGLVHHDISVLARPLTPEEAIGNPGRRDFPIIVGKERIVEACFMDSTGQAFTDAPGEFVGTLADVLELPMNSNRNRAIFVASMNAVMKHLNLIDKTVHCRDEEPEECGKQLGNQLLERFGMMKVGIIGYNPAIVEHICNTFGPENTMVADLFKGNIGQVRFGTTILDGAVDNETLISRSDVILITGTTIQNNSFPGIWQSVIRHGKKAMIFGVTGAAFCALTGVERLCPCSHD